MRATSLARSAVAFAVALMLAGCGSGDSPASPTRVRIAAPAEGRSSTLLSSPVTVTPLLRTTALAAPITVSKTIGILGGTIAVPGTGLVVVVPPLAVSSNTPFTLTALAGSSVAYDFEPHRTFNVPLVMTQDLHGTQVETGLANPLSLFAGYFPDANNTTSVTELLNVGVSLQSLTAVFTVTHFSGYIIATGRDDQ